MTEYLHDKMDAVAFVVATLHSLKPDSPLTMTITRAKSGDSYAYSVIASSSEDTDLQRAKFFSDTQVNT